MKNLKLDRRESDSDSLSSAWNSSNSIAIKSVSSDIITATKLASDSTLADLRSDTITKNVQEWLHFDLSNQTVVNEKGRQVSWIDHHYKSIYPTLYVLPRRIFEHYFFEFPALTIHSMFALTLLNSKNPPMNILNQYFTWFGKLLESTKDDLNVNVILFQCYTMSFLFSFDGKEKIQSIYASINLKIPALRQNMVNELGESPDLAEITARIVIWFECANYNNNLLELVRFHKTIQPFDLSCLQYIDTSMDQATPTPVANLNILLIELHKQSMPLIILLRSQKFVETSILNKVTEYSVRRELKFVQEKLLAWKIQFDKFNPMKNSDAGLISYLVYIKLSIQYYFTLICVNRIKLEELISSYTESSMDGFLKDSDTVTDLIAEVVGIDPEMTTGHLVFIYTLGLVRIVLEETVKSNNRISVYMQALKKMEDKYDIPRGKYTNALSKFDTSTTTPKARLFKYLSDIEDLY